MVQLTLLFLSITKIVELPTLLNQSYATLNEIRLPNFYESF